MHEASEHTAPVRGISMGTAGHGHVCEPLPVVLERNQTDFAGHGTVTEPGKPRRAWEEWH